MLTMLARGFKPIIALAYKRLYNPNELSLSSSVKKLLLKVLTLSVDCAIRYYYASKLAFYTLASLSRSRLMERPLRLLFFLANFAVIFVTFSSK